MSALDMSLINFLFSPRKLLFYSIVCIVLYFYIYKHATSKSRIERLTFVDDETNEKLSLLPKFVNPQTNLTTVLMWTFPWGVKSYGIEEGTVIGKCVFTYDRQHLTKSHAVVFHHSAFSDGKVKLPWFFNRHPDQIFVWFSMECPSSINRYEPAAIEDVPSNFINWTMTYRTDADVFYPYVDSKLLKEARSARTEHIDAIIKKKKRLALWVVSNCNKSKAARDRWKYVEGLLAAGLSLDRYGGCFNNALEYNKLIYRHDEINSYKFYLAFENGLQCRDYITEKFWDNGLLSGRVPVVWGTKKKDLLGLVPPGSFIHTDDFKSPASLAAYLMYLNQNTNAYRRYFEWMEKPKHFDEKFSQYYDHIKEELLCLKIRKNKDHKSISNFKRHIFSNDRKACFEVND